MSHHETIAVEDRLVLVEYDSEVEELPSFYSPGHPGGLCINSLVLDDGTDALPYVMEKYNYTERQALAWVEWMLECKLTAWAQDAADLRASMMGDDRGIMNPLGVFIKEADF